MFVNIAAVPLNTLNLTRVALAGIFAGVITRWDDPEILNANPTVTASQLNGTVTVRDRATAYAHACRWCTAPTVQAPPRRSPRGCSPSTLRTHRIRITSFTDPPIAGPSERGNSSLPLLCDSLTDSLSHATRSDRQAKLPWLHRFDRRCWRRPVNAFLNRLRRAGLRSHRQYVRGEDAEPCRSVRFALLPWRHYNTTQHPGPERHTQRSPRNRRP